MESAAERYGERPIAVPAGLDDAGLETGVIDRLRQRLRGSTGIDEEIELALQPVGGGEGQAERVRQSLALRIAIDEQGLGRGDAGAEMSHQTADETGPEHRHPVARLHARIPDDGERRLHIGGKNSTPRRKSLGQKPDGMGRNQDAVLMGMKRKDRTPAQSIRPSFDDADGRIAIFDGKGEGAAHEGAAHALMLALRHTTVEDAGIPFRG